MATHYTTNSLIEAIKLKGMIPTSQNTINTENFITFINEEMDLGVLPHILAFHEDNFTRSEVVSLTAGQYKYQIPSRAVGNKLKDVYLMDYNGNLLEMTRISNGELSDYNQRYQNSAAFYLEGDSIVLLGEVTSTDKLKFLYHTRPNRIVQESRAAKILSVSGSTVVIGAIPTSGGSNLLTVGTKCDIVRAKSPHSCAVIDSSIVSINAVDNTHVITLSDTNLATVVKPGDYLNLAEETIIPQVPPELHGLLAQRVVARCLEALGDSAGLQAANAKIAELEIKTGSLIDNRVENAPQKVKNRWGLLSNLKRRNWW